MDAELESLRAVHALTWELVNEGEPDNPATWRKPPTEVCKACHYRRPRHADDCPIATALARLEAEQTSRIAAEIAGDALEVALREDHEAHHEALERLDAMRERLEAAERALQDIANWSDAYPLSAFPEPDFARARELLEGGGMTLDAVSASNMRHVVEGVGKIAKAALAAQDTNDLNLPAEADQDREGGVHG